MAYQQAELIWFSRVAGCVLLALLFAIYLFLQWVDSCASKRPFLCQFLSTMHLKFGAINGLVQIATPPDVRAVVAKSPIIRAPTSKLFPHIGSLRANWRAIRQEALAALPQARKISKDAFFQRLSLDGKWKRIRIKWYSPTFELLALKTMPQTCSLLAEMPEVQCAMVSVLEPGAVIPPHEGPSRLCWRYHLCLQGPDNDSCYMEVGGHRYSWRVGEDVMFDDTFMHQVHYEVPTPKKEEHFPPRVVLFLDIAKEQSGVLSCVSPWLLKNLAPLATRSNEKNEKTEKQFGEAFVARNQ